ncbi:DUF1937 family protein [Chelatococcus sp. YT9]|uniref:DUF1937 family protein n=1 Tax=Chelatococcus sp. YT9 TaxID=2835635 RepID=UPI001BCF4A84|nr:DUF1937 family protein [Chelatococcus sp. YT9]MBS7698622.1 DUF1937 family protein [Chelatococcus sp. YT9]
MIVTRYAKPTLTAANANKASGDSFYQVAPKLDDLRDLPGFVYLGQPFTMYQHGHRAAAYDGSRAAAKLIERGFRVFAPIPHSHRIAEVGNLSQTDQTLWEYQDKPFVDAASSLIVLMLPGWDRSKGLAHEIDQFEKAGKPVVYLSLSDLD